MVTDAIESKLYREPPARHKKAPESICKLFPFNKAVELISLPSNLTNTQIVSLLKDLPCNFVTSTVVYNLQQHITSSMFNFSF